jgi:hypothetical protein
VDERGVATVVGSFSERVTPPGSVGTVITVASTTAPP